MAALLESDAKRLLADHGVAIPRGQVCRTRDDVADAAEGLRGAVVVKALIPSKGKQVAGGIHFASSPEQAGDFAHAMLGSTVAGFHVRELLVESREQLVSEIYASVALDHAARGYRLTVAAHGGANVEQQLSNGEGRTLLFQPDTLPKVFEVRDLLIACGVIGAALRSVPDAIVRICVTAVDADATLLEVNPIGLRADGSACAIGVLASLDESALYRHPELERCAIPNVDQLMRPLTPWEEDVDELNRALPDGGDIRFGEFPDGDIGIMVLGGGAGLMALDALTRAGGKPANFLDMTSAAGQAEEKLYRLTKIFLRVKHLRGLIVGSNIGAFLPVPIRMKGIARALREMLPSRGRFPVVIRLAGIADDEVAPIIDGLPITYFRDEVTLEDAVDVFMRELGGAK